MSKCLTVVALSLLVLTGAMGLRNIVAANASTLSGSNLSVRAIGPAPPFAPEPNLSAREIGPAPPLAPGSSFSAREIGPAPPFAPRPILTVRGIGPAPPFAPGSSR